MSNTGDNGSWNQAGEDSYGHQDPYAPQQDAWGQAPAQSPAPQDPYGQQQDAWGQPEHSDPFAQPQQHDPYGQGTGAPDPFAPGSPRSAGDPYGQGQQGWSGAQPHSQQSPAFGQQSPGYGQQSPAYGPAGAGGAQAPQGAMGQSRLVVGLLGIFLGGFGVHRFLMGYTTIGIIQIAVTIVTCGVGAWWGIIEGIMVLARAQAFERDAYGRPLAD